MFLSPKHRGGNLRFRKVNLPSKKEVELKFNLFYCNFCFSPIYWAIGWETKEKKMQSCAQSTYGPEGENTEIQ